MWRQGHDDVGCRSEEIRKGFRGDSRQGRLNDPLNQGGFLQYRRVAVQNEIRNQVVSEEKIGGVTDHRGLGQVVETEKEDVQNNVLEKMHEIREGRK